jgi:hypothetical protein
VIVRAGDDHLLLVTQPDHAAVAETIMSAWAADRFPSNPRRGTVLFAVRRHDDAWLEEDRSPIVDEQSGRVLDFTETPDDVRRRIWPRGIAAISSTPYATALVAEHALHLHDRHRADPAWREFFCEIEQARDRALARSAPGDADHVSRDYFFVRMGDLLSLVFCNGWREPHHESAYEARFDGERLHVIPDPFGGQEVPLEIAARRLPNRPFHTRRDAAAALAAAPLVALTGIASGQ